MKRSILAGAGAATLGATTAVTALVLGTMTGHAQTGESSAYGISADGIIPIEPTPYVESTDGTEQTETQIDLSDLPNIAGGVATVSAGDDTASVEIADLKIENDSETLTIEAITVECDGSSGSTTVAGVSSSEFDIEIPASPEPNFQPIPDNPVINLVINQQIENSDGSFTVNGMYFETLEGDQTVTLGSVTCGGPADNGGDNGGDDGEDGDNGDDGGDDTDSPEATKPAPVTTGLPVTG